MIGPPQTSPDQVNKAAAALDLVLFDLDGTLADTLPDLCWALNAALGRRGLAAVQAHTLRPVVSGGSRQIVRTALASASATTTNTQTQLTKAGCVESIRTEFLQIYQENIDRNTRLFAQTPELLDRLDRAGMPWGVVTNKLSRFTAPLMCRLGLSKRAVCVVCGDTTPHSKPHPAPLIRACQLARTSPSRSIYIGDAPGDVSAAHRAGMPAIVAQWGYLPAHPPASSWGAEYLASSPASVGDLLLDATNAEQRPHRGYHGGGKPA